MKVLASSDRKIVFPLGDIQQYTKAYPDLKNVSLKEVNIMGEEGTKVPILNIMGYSQYSKYYPFDYDFFKLRCTKNSAERFKEVRLFHDLMLKRDLKEYELNQMGEFYEHFNFDDSSVFFRYTMIDYLATLKAIEKDLGESVKENKYYNIFISVLNEYQTIKLQ